MTPTISFKDNKPLLESAKFATITHSVNNKKTLSSYIIGRKLGTGSYGVVYHATHPCTSSQFAVKCINKQKVTMSGHDKTMEHLLTEIEVMSTVISENIIRLYDVFQDQTNYYLILDYCNKGDFVNYMKERGIHYLAEQEAVFFLKQIKNAFFELRKHQVMHRDVKLENLFIHNETLKLGDFGFSKIRQSRANSILGSKYTMAPEILLNIGKTAKYDAKVDLWSVGCVFYEMLFGEKFNHLTCKDGSIKTQIKSIKMYKEEDLYFPRPISESAKNMLRRLLTKNSLRRMSFEEFFAHELFREEGGYEKHNYVTGIVNRNDKWVKGDEYWNVGNENDFFGV